MFDFLDRSWNRLSLGGGARLLALVVLAAATAWIAHARGTDVAPDVGIGGAPPAPSAARIEVAFVLDTTGSMAGLIDGAKQKIWSIANQLAGAQGSPGIRLGLIGYRDRGDSYVTAVHDLSDDVDALYAHLQGFSADGGGDGPEAVNQALHEALTRLSWSSRADVYRVIFLVGDAPPHLDYTNDVPYAESVRLARSRGIVVNTIQCGGDPETARIWREIAQLNQGHYAAIAQDGGMIAVSAPQDHELARLNEELAGTALAYGARAEREELDRKLARSLRASPESAAARLSYLAKQGGALASGRSDLVDAVASGAVALDALPPALLPEPMQAMLPEERRRLVAEKAEERKQLQSRIAELAKERDAYLAARAAKPDQADSFDGRVFGAIRSQAAEKGIRF